jgi:hypothetical protein
MNILGCSLNIHSVCCVLSITGGTKKCLSKMIASMEGTLNLLQTLGFGAMDPPSKRLPVCGLGRKRRDDVTI